MGLQDEASIDGSDFDADESRVESQLASWLDEPSREVDEVQVDEYDIVASPNDWNFTTIVNFIESGAMKIPTFQRNYVWDKKRASKLIESLLIGLPVPQVFLYEESKNSFLVIDGQQRLLTLYFFAKGRFPRPKVRGDLRPSLAGGVISDALLADDAQFETFRLQLPKLPGGSTNRFHGLAFAALGEDQTALNLRTIRNIVVKQTSPEGDSAVFEIFSRLNTGGMNLSPQEIRASLYHSPLLDGVLLLNHNPTWRKLVGTASPDMRMKDTEFLLRALALARRVDQFSGSMASFVNSFCNQARSYDNGQVTEACDDLRAFISLFEGHTETFRRAGKFSGVLFESAFAAWRRRGRPKLEADGLAHAIDIAKSSQPFAATLQEGSTKAANIKDRYAVLESAFESVR
jgi:hypothetical protein